MVGVGLRWMCCVMCNLIQQMTAQGLRLTTSFSLFIRSPDKFAAMACLHTLIIDTAVNERICPDR